MTGFDIEQKSITYAQATYPDISFEVSDIADVHLKLSGKFFNLICLFNSFYAFKDQEQALKNLSQLGDENCDLIIFDYTDLSDGKNNPLIVKNNPEKNFLPIDTKNISVLIKNAGWRLIEIQDLSSEYEIWYERLLSLIEKNKNVIVSDYGKDGYSKAIFRYNNVYHAIKDKLLGGCIVYARRIKS